MNEPVANTDVDPRPGEKIDGRFKIVKRLGPARSGWRWLAEQQPLGRIVEIMLLDPLPPDSDAGKRFEREATALCKLSHPNVRQVYDRGTWNKRPFLVTEYVEGQTLAELFDEGIMDPNRLLSLARQVAAALSEAHNAGFIHRDVRPETIRVVKNNVDEEVVRVVDFGLVLDLGPDAAEITEPGSIVGSLAYLAPEQIRGGYVDRRADVYGLGVLLYRGLTGKLPFAVGGGGAFDAQLNDPPPPFDADLILPPVVEWTVRTCLEKDPKDRFAEMADLAVALRAASIALIDPPQWNVALRLDHGHTIAPAALGDLSASWSSAYRTPAPVARAEAPVHNARRPTAQETLASGTPTPQSTIRPTPAVNPTVDGKPAASGGVPWLAVGGVAVALIVVLLGGAALVAGTGAGLLAASQSEDPIAVGTPASAAPTPSPDRAAPPAAERAAPPAAVVPPEAPVAVAVSPDVAVADPPADSQPPVALAALSVPTAPSTPEPAAHAPPVATPAPLSPSVTPEPAEPVATPAAPTAAATPPVPEPPVAVAPAEPVAPPIAPVVPEPPPKPVPVVTAPPATPQQSATVATASASAATTSVRTFPASSMKAKRQIPFTYPDGARKAGLGDADCKVRVFIDTSGLPNKVEPIACGDAFLGAARETLLKWRWEPAQYDGAPVAAQFQMLVRFTD